MKSKLTFFSKTFFELDLEEIYTLLQLRSEIFVVEQNCVYQDIDGKDKAALHILAKMDGQIMAYARCFPPGFYFEQAAIGRVLIRMDCRGKGYGHLLIKEAIRAVRKAYGALAIKVSAQQHLMRFYEAHGFDPVGDGYLEDGIPHIAMIKNELAQ